MRRLVRRTTLVAAEPTVRPLRIVNVFWQDIEGTIPADKPGDPVMRMDNGVSGRPPALVQGGGATLSRDGSLTFGRTR